MGAQRSHLHQRRKPRCARWHTRANLASQLQLDSLDLDVVVVVDSALGLVDVVLVVVVGVVQGADCSGPLCTTGTSARLPCSNAWVVGARGRNCPPIHLQPFANNHNPSLLTSW